MVLSHGGESCRAAGPAERRALERALRLTPDEASSEASSETGCAFASEHAWSETGFGGPGVVWGIRAGGDGPPYRTAVDTGEPAYTCGCGEETSPCGHALGLLLLDASGDRTSEEMPERGKERGKEPPDWVAQWLEDRHPRAAPGGRASRAAELRAARRAERITGGAQELEQRLSDLVRGGLAAADRPGYALWEETAARMVDAQAPGLAGRVRELGSLPVSGPGRPARLLEECALLHLLDSAWLGLDRLPGPLAATVRTRVGLTASAEGPAVRDHWLVLAQYDTPDGRIVTRRTWLYGGDSGRTALFLSYGAPGRAPARTLPVGTVLDAEVTPYPGGGGLRGELGREFGEPAVTAAAPPGGTTADAVAAYGRALRDDPWLDAWPATLRDVIPAPSGDGWQLVGAADGSALPVAPSALSRPGLWKLVALSGGSPLTVFGECGHRGFDPLAAWCAETSDDDEPSTAAVALA
ncbi:SWIM zinc finger family protein [Streptomyces sp. NBC_01012]|uniref:SWIM zinc finger family protein n=1 Tax=Streptomyces sp. NBC_01012 TaxID=2903717 RepID=UPI00386CE2BA|nr:SWIM zinc finger family protein [Streptomyces sp. NBC_01012]